MEVYVRNVPPQSTKNGLASFLKPHLLKLSIRGIYYQKQHDKTFAYLTFLNQADGNKFLAQHGQMRFPLANRASYARQNSVIAVKLFFLGRQLYCEISNRLPDPQLLRVLEKEEKDCQNESLHHTDKLARLLPLSFDCESVSCGNRSYVDSDLVFDPQLIWKINGVAKFGHRALVVNLDSGQRIDFLYLGANEITMEDGAFVFSMHEPPQFFETIPQSLEGLIAELGLNGGAHNPPKRNGPDRHRCSSFDEDHKEIVGSCLVYRIGLKQRNQSADHDRMQTLQKALRQIVHRYTKIVPWPEPYAVGLRQLQDNLSSVMFGLPFPVTFQVQKLVQNAYLAPKIVADLIPAISDMVQRSSVPICVGALRKLFPTISYPAIGVDPAEYQLDSLIDRLKAKEELCQRDGLLLDEAKGLGNVAIIHRAKVTPTSVFLYGPDPETTNRVLRKYADHHEYFLRVQFCDEDGMPVRYNPRISNYRVYHNRFKEILINGIRIADRKFDFLGFSYSSLRAQTCWFVAPFNHNGGVIWDRMIIRELGKFSDIQSPARCAARIGQTFSDTPVTVSIDQNIVRKMEDVKFNERVFSDGVGTMSSALMYKIWDKLSKASRKAPTCFQIRYAGAKGMISLDTRLQGETLVLRPSMIKFEGTNKIDIEICESAYKPLPAYLNRQFIKILEDMGVEEKFFLDLQQREVNRLRMIVDSPTNASTFLKRQSIGDAIHLPWLVAKLAQLGLNFQLDGFLCSVLELVFLMELRLLKHKTRIPVEKGYHLHGIMDETGTLKEGQIYCTARKNGVNRQIAGKNLIISRLSGGDLDGDRYYVIWDEACRPKTTFVAADYPRQEPVDIGRTVTRDDMTDFFIQFMETDQLARIAVLHRVIADQKPEGTLHPSCITLAGMHSTAVDFSKTGIPVDLTQMPRYKPYRPDFEAPGPYVNIIKNEGLEFETPSDRDPDVGDDDDDFSRYRYYESNKILGKLYRAIDERKTYNEIKQRSEVIESTDTATLINGVWTYVERQCKLIQWKHKKEWAWELREQYEECLLNIMTEFSEHPLRPLTELEAFVGNILGRTGAQSKRQRELSMSLKEKFQFDSAFFVNCILKDGDEWSVEALERSIACLAVSLEDRKNVRRGEELLSFKYVAAAVCLKEVERVMEQRIIGF